MQKKKKRKYFKKIEGERTPVKKKDWVEDTFYSGKEAFEVRVVKGELKTVRVPKKDRKDNNSGN